MSKSLSKPLDPEEIEPLGDNPSVIHSLDRVIKNTEEDIRVDPSYENGDIPVEFDDLREPYRCFQKRH